MSYKGQIAMPDGEIVFNINSVAAKPGDHVRRLKGSGCGVIVFKENSVDCIAIEQGYVPVNFGNGDAVEHVPAGDLMVVNSIPVTMEEINNAAIQKFREQNVKYSKEIHISEPQDMNDYSVKDYGTIELKDCPFCGCKEIWSLQETEGAFRSLWFAKCSGCNARSCYADERGFAEEEWNNRIDHPDAEKIATYENLLLNKIECLESALMEIAKQKTHKETCEEGGFMFEAECQSRADKEKDKAIVFFRNIARKCFPDKEWK